MSIIIVSDIFGKTPALVQLGAELCAMDIVDPYEGRYIEFKDESEAYTYFMNKVGLDSYLNILVQRLRASHENNTVIGFSVGGSILWQLCANASQDRVERAICFYGSQIRYFTDLIPQVAVDLILPRSEPHFDITLMEETLTKREGVTVSKTPYLHGFMNYHSVNYSREGYREYIAWLHEKVG